jgi:hypothetical protein
MATAKTLTPAKRSGSAPPKSRAPGKSARSPVDTNAPAVLTAPDASPVDSGTAGEPVPRPSKLSRRPPLALSGKKVPVWLRFGFPAARASRSNPVVRLSGFPNPRAHRGQNAFPSIGRGSSSRPRSFTGSKNLANVQITMAVPDPALEVREIEKGPTFEVWQGSGTMRLDCTRQGVVRIIVSGHGHAEFVPAVLRRWDGAIRAAGSMTLLVDFWDMPAYDSGLRVPLQGWGVSHRSQVEAIHFLSRSKLVAMGAAVSNLALGGMITMHNQQGSFDAVAKKLGLPVISGPFK